MKITGSWTAKLFIYTRTPEIKKKAKFSPNQRPIEIILALLNTEVKLLKECLSSFF